MKSEICTIEIGSYGLDDDYTFFNDGSVHHKYDQSNYKINLEENITVSDITLTKREKILQVCKPEYIEQIKNFFTINPLKIKI